MDSSQAVYDGLKEAGIDFVVSVPCVNLGKLMEMVECDPDIIHVPVTREEEGFGIAAGAYMEVKTSHSHAELWTGKLSECSGLTL